MGLFDFAKKKFILSTFQNDFDKFRTASMTHQVVVGRKIFADIQAIGSMSASELSSAQPRLREKYKYLRSQSVSDGATNELDPNYAYAALMESLVLSLGDEKISQKIASDLMGWLSYIGVVVRDGS